MYVLLKQLLLYQKNAIIYFYEGKPAQDQEISSHICLLHMPHLIKKYKVFT